MDKSKPLKTNNKRQIRGCAWYYSPVALRAAVRYGFYPDFRDSVLGFRLIKAKSNEK